MQKYSVGEFFLRAILPLVYLFTLKCKFIYILRQWKKNYYVYELNLNFTAAYYHFESQNKCYLLNKESFSKEWIQLISFLSILLAKHMIFISHTYRWGKGCKRNIVCAKKLCFKKRSWFVLCYCSIAGTEKDYVLISFCLYKVVKVNEMLRVRFQTFYILQYDLFYRHIEEKTM